MGGFAFNYLRADLSESRIGPFDYEFEAETRKQRFLSFGATCSSVFPTDDEPPKKKDNYAEQKLDEFKNFFGKEMALLEAPGVSYSIVYQFLLTLIYHIKLYVAKNDWSKSEFAETIAGKTGYPPNFYLEEIAKFLLKEAGYYNPLDGSVPEDIGEELKKLAQQIRSGQVLNKKKSQADLISSFSGYSL